MAWFRNGYSNLTLSLESGRMMNFHSNEVKEVVVSEEVDAVKEAISLHGFEIRYATAQEIAEAEQFVPTVEVDRFITPLPYDPSEQVEGPSPSS